MFVGHLGIDFMSPFVSNMHSPKIAEVRFFNADYCIADDVYYFPYLLEHRISLLHRSRRWCGMYLTSLVTIYACNIHGGPITAFGMNTFFVVGATDWVNRRTPKKSCLVKCSMLASIKFYFEHRECA